MVKDSITHKNNEDENAKNPDFIVPMDLPEVKPEDYDADIESGRGSAQSSPDSVQDDPLRKQQKESGQLPLHDKEIGGA